MCEHLQPLENYLQAKGISETYRGQVWSENCKEWVYFDCILKTDLLKKKFKLPQFVETHENADAKSGMELGLVCTLCKDAIVGIHPDNFLAKQKVMVS